MYQCGDRVVYGMHGVCNIIGMEVRAVDRKKIEYYVLEPQEQPGARFYVPTGNPAAVAKLRPLLEQQELEEILHAQSANPDAWIPDENQRKQRYRELISSGDRAQLLCMVGALYKHKEELTLSGRKFHLCDENFLRDAKKLLDSEISLVLNIHQDEVGSYIKKTMHPE